MHYFAYGSNMSLARIASRLPGVRRVGAGWIPGYRLVFHKAGERDGSAKCDAFFSGDPTHRVYGAVYLLDDGEKILLDAIEGVGNGYDCIRSDVFLEDGRTVNASFYAATCIDPSLLPFTWYREHVLRGALENGLPEWYIREIRNVPAVDDPDPCRAAKELAIYLRA